MASEWLVQQRAKENQLRTLREGRTRLNDCRTAKLLADGRTALAMRKRGARPTEILATIGGSRPRMYQAIHKALDTDGWGANDVDPLLL